MVDATEALIYSGLTKNDAKVYVTVLEQGLTGVSKVSKVTKIARSNIYESINRLMDKGLVAESNVDGKTYYEATDPVNLLNLLRDKELKLKQILPQLELYKRLAPDQGQVLLYHGVQAAKNTLYKLLEKRKPIYVIGTPPNISKVAKAFLVQFHKERIAKKIPMFHCYSSAAQPDFDDVGVPRMPYTENRHLPEGLLLPMSTTICDDEVQLKFWTQNGIVIIIKSKEVVEVYKHYFDIFWKISKPVQRA